VGGIGTDTLTGGAGADTLTGGQGADTLSLEDWVATGSSTLRLISRRPQVSIR